MSRGGDGEMKCNICQNETFDEITQTVSSYGGSECGDYSGNSESKKPFNIKQWRKIGTKNILFDEKVNIYACQKCGNLQIEVNQ